MPAKVRKGEQRLSLREARRWCRFPEAGISSAAGRFYDQEYSFYQGETEVIFDGNRPGAEWSNKDSVRSPASRSGSAWW